MTYQASVPQRYTYRSGDHSGALIITEVTGAPAGCTEPPANIAALSPATPAPSAA